MTFSFSKYVLLVIVLFSTSNILFAQTCTEIDILEEAACATGHEFGSNVDLDVGQFVVGARGMEQCYFYQEDAAGVWNETILFSTGGEMYEEFGHAVAANGDRIVVGAPWNSENASGVGVIYVYDWDGLDWIETKLSPSDGQTVDFFGSSVDVLGDRIVVGAPTQNSNGAAYIFDLVAGIWEETIIIPSSNGNQFGYSVSMKQDTVLIGAPGSNHVFLYNYDGTEWVEEMITGSDTSPYDNFGADVDIDEGRFIVSADEDDTAYFNAGAIYVFEKMGTTWEETEIIATDANQNSELGRSVSLSGDTIIAGQPKSGSDQGKIYLFVNDNGTWVEDEMFASDGEGNDMYGFGVSILNGDLLVGASGDANGSVYHTIIDNGVVTENKYTPSDANTKDYFGFSVEVDAAFLAVGAPRDNDLGVDAGAVYIYEKNGSSWDFNTKLMASDGGGGDWFGFDVDVQNQRVVVGAARDSDNLYRAGSAYVFEWNGTTWTETKLQASDETSNAYLGNSVGIHEDRLIVGNEKDAVYVFELINGVWTETEILTDSNATTDDRFGYHVDIDEGRILIGAHYNDVMDTNSGAVYVFDYDGANWNETILFASFTSYYNAFGRDVALDKDRFVAAALGQDPGGVAYVFDYDGTNWNETQIVSGGAGEGFGYGVGLSGNRFVVGAAASDDDGSFSGSAYVFDLLNGNWESTKITASDASYSSWFGRSVSIFEETMLVGTDSCPGKAYIYDCPCIDNLPPVAVCQDITVALDISGSITIQSEEIDGGSTDDCPLESLTLDQSTFDCSQLGMQQVTLTVSDVMGNEASCSADVEVTDPLVTCIPCENSLLTINNADITGNDILFNDTDEIESDAVISFDNIHYKAKNLIDLQVNFEVIEGKVFTAEIGPCP